MNGRISRGGGPGRRTPLAPRATVLGGVLLLLLRLPAGAQGVTPALRLDDCRVLENTVRARCGVYRVYEDREARSGRRIDLNLVVVPAEDGTTEPDPVFLLAGGPGQVATDLVQMVSLLPEVHRHRDMIFVDQRGTGGSNPLVCPESGDGTGEYGPEGDAFWDACLLALRDKADLRLYTTPAAVDDFDEVRAALGYPRVNLIGGSYGTRVAQVYLERHPERVRSAVLWAVAPIGYDIPVGGGLAVQAAMERLLADCRADAHCGAAFPRLEERLDSLLTGLGDEPVRVALGAEGDEPEHLTITRDLFAQSLLALLFDAGHMRMLPALVDRAAGGDWAVLASIAAQVLEADRSDPDGLYLSVLCNEDLPYLRRERLAEFRGSFGALLRESAEDLIHRCARWPAAEPSVRLRAPIRSLAPVLLLSGAADPATPPDGGERALRYLRNARHVEVPASSHGPIFPGCVRDLVAEFIARPQPGRLDAGCVQDIRWKPFAVPGGGGAS